MYRIVRKDLRLKCFKKRRAQELTAANRDARLTRAKKLLRLYPQSAVDFIFFSDEKIFTVAPPVNLQNDRVYVPQSSKKRDVAADRLLRTRPTFSKSLMVSVAVSKLGCTELIFVQPGANVNGAYYRDELLVKQMLPAIRQIAGDHFIFQQDSAPAHHRDTIEFLRRSTPQFITPDLWPPNSPGARFSKVPKSDLGTFENRSPDLNPVDYNIWDVMQDRVYKTAIRDLDDLKRRLIAEWSGLQQAEYCRRRCRSVAQTSALLRGNERPSLRTFAVTLQLELV